MHMADVNDDWPRKPELQGFYTYYGMMPSGTRKVVEPSTGAVIRYSVSQNQWDERSPRIRQIRACAILFGNRKPACWTRLDLIDDGGQQLDDDNLGYAARLALASTPFLEATYN